MREPGHGSGLETLQQCTAVSGEAGALIESLDIVHIYSLSNVLHVLFDEEENLLGAGKGIKPKNNSMCSEPIESGSGYSYINKTFR